MGTIKQATRQIETGAEARVRDRLTAQREHVR